MNHAGNGYRYYTLDQGCVQVPVMGVLRNDLEKNYAWPGNVRELEQAIRRIVLTGSYAGDTTLQPAEEAVLSQVVEAGTLTAKELVEKYCCDLYETYQSYGEVARRTGLDWRTVKKNVTREAVR